MILLELFGQMEEKEDNGRYDPDSDQTIVKKDDTRKTRLTLKQINKLRKISELRAAEKLKAVPGTKKLFRSNKKAAHEKK